MKIRFQADADLNGDIVAGVHRHEALIDFQTADEAGLEGIQDQDVLFHAAREGRVLVTHDRKTMPYHFAAFITTETSPGLLIISQNMDIRSAIEELIMIWAASEAEEWVNLVLALPL